jgi:hypothetical protein
MAGQSKVTICFTGPFGNHHILCIFILQMNDSVSPYLKVGVHPKNHHIPVVGDVLVSLMNPETYLMLKNFLNKIFVTKSCNS